MLEDELNYFLSSSQRNLWIGNDRVAVYVRKSKGMYWEHVIPCWIWRV